MISSEFHHNLVTISFAFAPSWAKNNSLANSFKKIHFFSPTAIVFAENCEKELRK
jgi:hypothetical protein